MRNSDEICTNTVSVGDCVIIQVQSQSEQGIRHQGGVYSVQYLAAPFTMVADLLTAMFSSPAIATNCERNCRIQLKGLPCKGYSSFLSGYYL